MDHSTSGGSSETAENEFTTIPTSWSSALVVTTVTPVANWPRARRNARASAVGSPDSTGPAVCCTSVMSVNGFVLSTGRKPLRGKSLQGQEEGWRRPSSGDLLVVVERAQVGEGCRWKT